MALIILWKVINLFGNIDCSMWMLFSYLMSFFFFKVKWRVWFIEWFCDRRDVICGIDKFGTWKNKNCYHSPVYLFSLPLMIWIPNPSDFVRCPFNTLLQHHCLNLVMTFELCCCCMAGVPPSLFLISLFCLLISKSTCCIPIIFASKVMWWASCQTSYWELVFDDKNGKSCLWGLSFAGNHLFGGDSISFIYAKYITLFVAVHQFYMVAIFFYWVFRCWFEQTQQKH